jgi:hypothetical protein
VIKFVSDFRLCSGFLWVSSTNKTDHNNITEILLKVALSTITTPIIDYIRTEWYDVLHVKVVIVNIFQRVIFWLNELMYSLVSDHILLYFILFLWFKFYRFFTEDLSKKCWNITCNSWITWRCTNAENHTRNWSISTEPRMSKGTRVISHTRQCIAPW